MATSWFQIVQEENIWIKHGKIMALSKWRFFVMVYLQMFIFFHVNSGVKENQFSYLTLTS